MFAVLIHGYNGKARIHPVVYSFRAVAEVTASNLQKDEVYNAEMSGSNTFGIYTEIVEVNTD